MRTRAWAIAAAGLATAVPAHADHNAIDLIEVFGKQDIRRIELADTRNINPDSAQLLREAPGADINSNGPLTGIAQYRRADQRHDGERRWPELDGPAVVLRAVGPA